MDRRAFVASLGAAIGFASRAHAQQQRPVPVIAFLHGSALVGQYRAYIDSFLAGLKEQGYEPGRNIAIEYRWAEGQYDRAPALAAELLKLKPVLAVIYGPPSFVRSGVDALPRSLPIIFGTGGDPVAAGIVPNLARPPGNVTGVANRTNSLDVKRMEFLRDLLPRVRVFGLVLNPKNSDAAAIGRAAQDGAKKLDRRLIILGASSVQELGQGFASAVQQGAGAMLMGSDTFLNAQREAAVALAMQHRLPTMYSGRDFVEIGGLMSYGASFIVAYRQIGIYAGKVLAGAKPSDLPVIEPARFELVINGKTAKTLGLAIPPTLLARADEVIE